LQRVKEERSKVEEKLRAELASSLTTAGTMLRNPVDPGHYARDFTDMMHLLDKWEDADMVLWQIAPDIEALQTETILQYIHMMRLHTLKTLMGLKKLKAVIVHGVESDIGLQALMETRKACAENKVAFYPSIYRAAPGHQPLHGLLRKTRPPKPRLLAGIGLRPTSSPSP